jgi:hypothetical protein
MGSVSGAVDATSRSEPLRCFEPSRGRWFSAKLAISNTGFCCITRTSVDLMSTVAEQRDSVL